MRAALLALMLAGCAAAESQPQEQAAAPGEVSAPAPTPAPLPPGPPVFVMDNSVAQPLAAGTTSVVPAPILAPLAPPPAPSDLTLNCAGAFQQGGIALCRTQPGAAIVLDGENRGRADRDGWFVIGFDRDSPGASRLEVTGAEGVNARADFTILPREFSVQRVDGLPQQTVTPTDPAIIARQAREREMKAAGTASRAEIAGWLDGFRWPVEGRISGSWGNQRILNGEPRSPHYGVDIAMPTGTPIHAPAAGVVSLAEPDMHLEGGLVFIDHGQGLISMYLHMSRLDVRAGDRVAQGQVIGAVGAAGRTTGPHLCWRMRWRDRQLDPSLAILGLAEARNRLASGR